MISIIIPTYNRARCLEATLDSINIQLKKNIDTEVIVIDNGSTDLTNEICKTFENKISKFKYIYDSEPGLLTGRHRGTEVAEGEVLCFLDDDVTLNPNYIYNLAELFSTDKNVQLATGPCLPDYEIDPPEWLGYFWSTDSHGKYCTWLSLLDLGESKIEINPNFVWGLNFCIRKAALLDLGGFHPDCIPDELQCFQGDGETGLTTKALERGFQAIYHPGLALKHYVPAGRLTYNYFKKRAFYQGVCNSYTDLRSNAKTNLEKAGFFKKTRNMLHPYYGWIKNFFQPSKNRTLPSEIENMMLELARTGDEGYGFHQDQFKNNEQIREWVKKSNYWDYKLPKK